MTAKHSSMNSVLWRVVSGRIRRGRGRDATAGLQLDNPVVVYFVMDAYLLLLCFI